MLFNELGWYFADDLVFSLLRVKLAELAEEEFFRAKTAKMLAHLMDQKVEKHLLKYSVSVHFKCEDLLASADFCSMKTLFENYDIFK